MSSLYGWLYSLWRRSRWRSRVRKFDWYRRWHAGRINETLNRFRAWTSPVRYALRQALLPQSRIQRFAPLLPEDRTHRRRRHHVLVDLIHEYGPSSGLMMAEVGTDTGKTSAHILKYCPQVQMIVAVDLEAPDPAESQIRGLDKVHFIKGSSDEVASQFSDEFFDLVFVDADHSEEWVERDLRAWFPKVRKGGLVVGHDYAAKHHPGVKLAVDRFFADHPHPLHFEANKVWWTLKA